MPAQTRIRAYERIAADLRKLIRDELKPGSLLPGEHALAARYAVHRMTVRQALDVVAREGLIHRQQGRGSVVADPAAMGECAIVVRPQLLDQDRYPFYSLVSTALVEAVGAANPGLTVRQHVGKRTDTGRDFPKTLDLLDPRILPHLRGVYTFHPLYELEDRLLAAHVPVVGFTETERYSVYVAKATLFEEGVAHLKRVGCRTIGVIRAIPVGCERKEDVQSEWISRLRNSSFAGRHPEWVEPYMGEIAERTGYEAFMRLWRGAARPEGLIVTDDIMCRGVLRAALHLGIELPRDLRLVTYSNRGIELPYHKPVTRVEFDPGELARRAVKMMGQLQAGKKPARRCIRLGGQLVLGETA
ncbi:MAG: substrate-binding domain-containing protein [Kiritimatiellae bacterium]|nr:substrate-binding domain-containing protein [Kiritimatiellia bacterium]